MAKVKVELFSTKRGDPLRDPVHLRGGWVVPRRIPATVELDGATVNLTIEVDGEAARAIELTLRSSAGITRRTLSVIPVRRAVFTAVLMSLWRTVITPDGKAELVHNRDLPEEAVQLVQDLVGYAPEKLEVAS